MTDATWTQDGLEGATSSVGFTTGRQDARTLEGFTSWVAQQRFAALNAYYESDRHNTAAFGEAIALQNINHKLSSEGIAVKDRVNSETNEGEVRE